MDMLCILIDNIFFTCGDRTFRQKIGIPMGTDCAPLVANLYLFALECKWIERILPEEPKCGKRHTTERTAAKLQMGSFTNACRYIDDLVILNSHGDFTKFIQDIYPATLVLERQGQKDKDGEFQDHTAEFLDTKVTIENDAFITQLYDKRNDFVFPIVKFQFSPSNYSNTQAHNILIGQCTRYARICHYYDNFKQCVRDDVKHMITKNGLNKKQLKQTLQKYCKKHRKLIYNKYHREGTDVVNECFQDI
jgi:hypothetical protein